ncbi:hypothetical protein RRG08_065351 [Elysia crispata]|uniref:Uncharacterized protein n=1 Tax=Elysia crispata TaxID=231223 RepID=A0AAE1DYU9_9GAST|nr:hypothetical protein RRG08_065351 [Elysia crispata]
MCPHPPYLERAVKQRQFSCLGFFFSTNAVVNWPPITAAANLKDEQPRCSEDLSSVVTICIVYSVWHSPEMVIEAPHT